MRQNEVQAAQKQLDNIDETIKQKTNKLLQEQETTLNGQKVLLLDTLNSLKIDVAQLSKSKEHLASSITDLKLQKTSLETSLGELSRSIQEANATLNGFLVLVDNAKTKNAKQVQSYNTLAAEVQRLESTERGLKDSIKELTDKKSCLYSDVERMEHEFGPKIEEKEAYIAELDGKIVSAIRELETLQKEEQRIREDLAVREKALEDRDQNLRLREAKADIADQRILANANLMKL